LESSNLVTLCRWLSSIVPTCFIGWNTSLN
jgi:hypothetical protein